MATATEAPAADHSLVEKIGKNVVQNVVSKEVRLNPPSIDKKETIYDYQTFMLCLLCLAESCSRYVLV